MKALKILAILVPVYAGVVTAFESLPFVFRVLTGFPPRYFLRLDPRSAPG